MQVFSALCFVKELKQPSQQQLQAKKKNLQKKEFYKDKKTLVFDLDETLIHCNDQKKDTDVFLPIKYENGDILDAGISVRPHAKKILKEMSKLFEIIIFTASQSCYADVVLDYLDPKGKYISHRLYRESCIQTEQGIYVKDLRVLNRELSQILIVDNAAYSFAFQIDNGIPIISYYDDQNDNELLDLIEYLKYLNNYEDLTQANRKQLKLQQFQEFDNQKILFQSLFPNYISNQTIENS